MYFQLPRTGRRIRKWFVPTARDTWIRQLSDEETKCSASKTCSALCQAKDYQIHYENRLHVSSQFWSVYECSGWQQEGAGNISTRYGDYRFPGKLETTLKNLARPYFSKKVNNITSHVTNVFTVVNKGLLALKLQTSVLWDHQINCLPHHIFSWRLKVAVTTTKASRKVE